MKKISVLLLNLLFAGSVWAGAGSEAMTVVHHFDLRNCNKSKCVKIEAAKAESGVFSPMLSLRKVEVTIINGKTKKHYVAPYGFLDLDGKRAVFRLSPLKELSLNLSTNTSEEFRL